MDSASHYPVTAGDRESIDARLVTWKAILRGSPSTSLALITDAEEESDWLLERLLTDGEKQRIEKGRIHSSDPYVALHRLLSLENDDGIFRADSVTIVPICGFQWLS